MSSYKEHLTFHRPAEIELIRTMPHRPLTKQENKVLDNFFQDAAQNSDAFIIKSAGDWLETTNEVPDTTIRLFGDFWYQGEVCIMFADTNVGKSILAVQIGDSLSKGAVIEGIGNQRRPEKVLYFDFELSAGQFKKRYHDSTYGNYQLAPTLHDWYLTPMPMAHVNLTPMQTT